MFLHSTPFWWPGHHDERSFSNRPKVPLLGNRFQGWSRATLKLAFGIHLTITIEREERPGCQVH
jgi:hypothetical protein